MTLDADVVVIGAGPAGLTAAYELARAGRRNVIVLEASRNFGGISKTVSHAGNRIDIGGHRFFSKSDWVMNWWQDMLPIALEDRNQDLEIFYQGKKRSVEVNDPAPPDGENVMLVRSRLSRIYFGGQFLDYPLKPTFDTAAKLGAVRCAKFGVSYAWAMANPRTPEKTLEDFLVNRFGRELYLQFFKDYTEKVWGVTCDQISAEWGAQRIKGLSIKRALLHAAAKPFARFSSAAAKATPTSLIERFLYPKYGPGQMWDRTADKLAAQGIRLLKHTPAVGLEVERGRISQVVAHDGSQTVGIRCQHVVSTMAVRDLVQAMGAAVPDQVRQAADGLEYRDFITVGLLYKQFRRRRESIDPLTNIVADNWIYIQEPGVKVGRLQIFNNWSPYMVRDKSTIWVGLEYFCLENDSLWSSSDSALIDLGVKEMRQIGLADPEHFVDGMVLRQPKAYPGYYGGYARFPEVRQWLDSIANLYLVGRNGMHRYNNQDHSMLSAKFAVDAILANSPDKTQIWGVNIDDEYHEEIKA